MKNKKLSLNELRVKSFVTDFKNKEENTVKGGSQDTINVCPSLNQLCEEGRTYRCITNDPIGCESWA